MRCLHPHCPYGAGLATWGDVVALPELKVSYAERAALLTKLNAGFSTGPVEPPVARSSSTSNVSLLKRLLNCCPCLFNQIDVSSTARSVVHFCELTIGARITSANVNSAFDIQHPTKGPAFKFRPLQACRDGGTVMEMLCSDALNSAGIPEMDMDAKG
jgi:hypothetical protein